MTADPQALPPTLVPELVSSDIARSRAFYRDVLGFEVRHERSEDRFLFLERNGAVLMVEQPVERSPFLPAAALDRPYGRGVSFELVVGDVDDVHAAIQAAGVEFLLPLSERWIERDSDAVGVREFAVQDPDGYVIRFAQPLGRRGSARRER
jgi:catechol 2,3-dioxygenase-like lactoylglutathione lyase family enzyme